MLQGGVTDLGDRPADAHIISGRRLTIVKLWKLSSVPC